MGRLRDFDFMPGCDFCTHKATLDDNFISPPTSALGHDHYDIAFIGFPVHNARRLNQRLWWDGLNDLAADKLIDQISGNVALDGVPFKIYGVQ